MATCIGVCAHGNLSKSLIEAMGMIAGVPEGIEAFPLLPGMDPFEYRAEIAAFVDAHETDDVLLLVDLFGGTPSNMCASLARREGIEVVAGVNLAMLIEVATMKNQMGLGELRDLALSCGAESLVDVRACLASRQG